MWNILKPFIDGSGTAAGVAFTFFGAVAGSAFLAVGSTAAVTLGGISLGIYFLVCLPIICWVFYEQLEAEKELNNSLIRKKEKLAKLMNQYLLLRIEYFSIKNNYTFFQDGELANYLHREINKINNFIMNENDKKIYINTLIKRYRLKTSAPPSAQLAKELKLSFHYEHKFSLDKFFPAFISFCGGFGTILGNACGIIALLSGLGLVGGFAAVPIVGWTALAIAILVGTILAITTYVYLHKKQKIEHLLNENKKVKKEVNNKLNVLNGRMKWIRNGKFQYVHKQTKNLANANELPSETYHDKNILFKRTVKDEASFQSLSESIETQTLPDSSTIKSKKI